MEQKRRRPDGDRYSPSPPLGAHVHSCP